MVRLWKGISAIALAAVAALVLYRTSKNAIQASAQTSALLRPSIAALVTPAPPPVSPAERPVLARAQHAAPQTALAQVENERPLVEHPLPTPQNFGSTGGQGPIPLLDMPPRPTPFSIVWLSDTQLMSCQRYPGRMAENGRYTIVGKSMFENVVKPNPNVRLVLCGHVCGTGFRAEDIDDTGDGAPDRRVNAMLYNYQLETIDSGQLRLLTFDPFTHGLTVMTYSPPLDRYFRDYNFASANFTIDGAF